MCNENHIVYLYIIEKFELISQTIDTLDNVKGAYKL